MAKKRISGTLEWAKYSVNCFKGCEHDCLYCYARTSALQRKLIRNKEEWKKPVYMAPKSVPSHKNDTTMFPTQHDITPATLDMSLKYILELLKAKNNLLIVSKPHLECIRAICDATKSFKQQILFRFTIGAKDDAILKFWEPGAPCFQERLESLKYAFEEGFETSVSCEPMLDAANIIDLVETLQPFITDCIWIGKMNKIDRRVGIRNEMVKAIEEGQTDANIKAIYTQLKNNPLIKWKESIKEVVGLELAEKAGEDR